MRRALPPALPADVTVTGQNNPEVDAAAVSSAVNSEALSGDVTVCLAGTFDFGAPPVTPSPSFAWEWEKWDLGIRLGVARGLDLTLEVAKNEFVLASGATREYAETLVTVRYRQDVVR